MEAFFIVEVGGEDCSPNRPLKWEPRKGSQGQELW